MIKMNDELLKLFPDEKKALAKLVLFSIHEDIDLRTYKDEQMDDINEICRVLGHKMFIETIYEPDRVTRLKLLKPLYVFDEGIDKGFTKEFRQLFSYRNIGEAGKMGDPTVVEEKLNEFKAQYSFTNEQILEGAKSYINYCRNSGRFIADAHNFIELHLAAYIEDEVYEETEQDNPL